MKPSVLVCPVASCTLNLREDYVLMLCALAKKI